MPKRAIPTDRPEIMLDASLSVPLYKQLYERLRGAILAGQLERGARLPSTRQLASELGVSRNTTALAYEQLLLEGYLESRVGQGTAVARHLPATLLREHTERTREKRADTRETPSIHLASRVRLLQEVPYPERVEGSAGRSFRSGEPALDLFPYEVWARLIARRARQSLRGFAHYQPAAGYYPLREAIAAHIGITRGVRCVPDQVILTAGSQGALDLAVRTLLNAGEVAWLENPGYFGARGALLAVGARLVPVPVDKQGLAVEVGRQRCPEARLVSTTPSHQFPTGLIEPLLATRRFIDVHVPILEQMALTDFMREGHFVRHLRRMLQHYSQRRDLLRHELRARLGGLLEVHAPEAGMHLVGWLPPGKDDRRAAELAAQAGIEVAPISRYSLEPLSRGGLLFGYAGTDEESILPGVKRLEQL